MSIHGIVLAKSMKGYIANYHDNSVVVKPTF